MLRIRTNERVGVGVGAVMAVGVLAVLCGAPGLLAAEAADASAVAEPMVSRPLALSMTPRAAADELIDPRGSLGGAPVVTPAEAFGGAGQRWWSLSFGVAPSSQTDSLVQLGYHQFLADDFEVGVFLGGWYHDQDENAAGSASLSLQFRYHLINRDAWSMYGLVGIGVMGSTHNVPDGGTGFNFLPTAGVGGTVRLGDGPARLDVGVRWHHISNANINGSGRNPDRDAAMIYVGVMFPF